jgi:hypothetical protein
MDVVVERPESPIKRSTGAPPAKASLAGDDREPIKVRYSHFIGFKAHSCASNLQAFLRIRPQPADSASAQTPYLKILSSASVQMTPPPPASASLARLRLPAQVSTYTFSQVFSPETRQPEFFTQTTLPLVRSLLNGENGLIFTYGVTNSGKTYTIQGTNEKEASGLLPRTLDVIFNSIEGLNSEAPVSYVQATCPTSLMF